MSFLARTPKTLLFGAMIIALYVGLEMSGVAFGGSRKEQRIDPTQIRSAAPGSWTYIYWAHGSRGK